MSDKYADSDSVRAAKRMMDSAGVSYRRYCPAGKHVVLDL